MRVYSRSNNDKVVRDDLLKKWEFDEIGPSFSKTLGSGYPGGMVRIILVVCVGGHKRCNNSAFRPCNEEVA